MKHVIALNHEPGGGYSIEAQLADGGKVEACVGKLSKSGKFVLITSNGIFGDDELRVFTHLTCFLTRLPG